MRIYLEPDNMYGIKLKNFPQLGWILAKYHEDHRYPDIPRGLNILDYDLAREFDISWVWLHQVSDIITQAEFTELPKELKGKKTLEQENNITLSQEKIMPKKHEPIPSFLVPVKFAHLLDGEEYFISLSEDWTVVVEPDESGLHHSVFSADTYAMPGFLIGEDEIFIPRMAADKVYSANTEKSTYESEVEKGTEFFEIGDRSEYLSEDQRCFVKPTGSDHFLVAYTSQSFGGGTVYDLSNESPRTIKLALKHSKCRTLRPSEVAQCKIALSDLPVVPTQEIKMEKRYWILFNSDFPKLREMGFLLATSKSSKEASRQDYFKVEGLVGEVRFGHIEKIVPHNLILDVGSPLGKFAVEDFMSFYEPSAKSASTTKLVSGYRYAVRTFEFPELGFVIVDFLVNPKTGEEYYTIENALIAAKYKSTLLEPHQVEKVITIEEYTNLEKKKYELKLDIEIRGAK